MATPSSEQVRRPIFADALDHWRNFEPWLDPLKAALGPVLDAYPAAAVAEALDPRLQDRQRRREFVRIRTPAAEPLPVQARPHLRRAGCTDDATAGGRRHVGHPGRRVEAEAGSDAGQLALEVVHQALVANLDSEIGSTRR